MINWWCHLLCLEVWPQGNSALRWCNERRTRTAAVKQSGSIARLANGPRSPFTHLQSSQLLHIMTKGQVSSHILTSHSLYVMLYEFPNKLIPSQHQHSAVLRTTEREKQNGPEASRGLPGRGRRHQSFGQSAPSPPPKFSSVPERSAHYSGNGNVLKNEKSAHSFLRPSQIVSGLCAALLGTQNKRVMALPTCRDQWQCCGI